MVIGLISDTHGHLPAAVFDVFKNVDHILHAGDIGKEEIIFALKTIAPVNAVYGNIDSWPVVSKYPRMEMIDLASKSFCLIHDIVNIKYFRFELFKKKQAPDIVVYGHTHISGHEFHQQILYINPGSASRPKKSKKGCVALIKIESDIVSEPEYIEINWR